MTDAPPHPAPRLGRFPGWVRPALPVVLLVALAFVAVLTQQTAGTRLPLDPDSTAPAGTKALALFLEEVGADVEVLSGPPTAGFDTVLVMIDNFNPADADRLLQHAADGGVLVVADAGGALTPRVRPSGFAGMPFGGGVLPRGCELAALHEAAEVDAGGEPLFEVPEGATGCYRRGSFAWLVAQPHGAGTTVVTGGPSWLTNRGMREADNAVLAGALLAPRPGTRVGIVRPGFAPADAGLQDTETLTDLIPASVKLAFAQLLVAFGVFIAWRARRLGKPLAEPQPVRLAGSELVVAVGHLLHRTGARRRAAALLRADLLAVLSRRLGAGSDTEPARLADAFAAHAGVDRTDVLDVLEGPEPHSDEELVVLAQRTESIRHAVVAPTAPGANRVDHA